MRDQTRPHLLVDTGGIHIGRQVSGVRLPLAYTRPGVDHDMLSLPILSTITVSGIGMNSVVRPALASAALVSSTEASLMKVDRAVCCDVVIYVVTSMDPTLYFCRNGRRL